MALEAILKRGLVWGREGPERRSERLQTRCGFSNLDLIDFRALGGAHA
jgi:hypothetical protein